MNYKFFLIIFISTFFISCAHVEFTTPSINRPITLSDIIGIDNTKVPNNVSNKGEVKGEISHQISRSYGSYSESEKAYAEQEFSPCILKSNTSFVSNLVFTVRLRRSLFGFDYASIEYSANCLDLDTLKGIKIKK